jgi:hypothetical protein
MRRAGRVGPGKSGAHLCKQREANVHRLGIKERYSGPIPEMVAPIYVRRDRVRRKVA